MKIGGPLYPLSQHSQLPQGTICLAQLILLGMSFGCSYDLLSSSWPETNHRVFQSCVLLLRITLQEMLQKKLQDNDVQCFSQPVLCNKPFQKLPVQDNNCLLFLLVLQLSWETLLLVSLQILYVPAFSWWPVRTGGFKWPSWQDWGLIRIGWKSGSFLPSFAWLLSLQVISKLF